MAMAGLLLFVQAEVAEYMQSLGIPFTILLQAQVLNANLVGPLKPNISK